MTDLITAEVLILSNLYDFPTDRICLELNHRGAHYLRLNAESLGDATVRLDPQTPRLEVSLDEQTWLVDATLRSVWWRQPTFLRNTPSEPLSLDEQLSQSQWPAFIRGLTTFDRARWLNHPAATYQAESKPWQLRVAAECGFETPRTLITNDPIAPVAPTLGARVAIKSVDTVLMREQDRQYFAYTQILNWSEATSPDLQDAPVIVQEAITPKLDLRVTVLEDDVWAVAVTADDAPIEGDWRLKKKAHLAYPAFDLPTDIGERCIALVRKMGLAFGAIDLALSGDRYIFIEINPTGEWGWLDTPERPLASAIAEALLR